MTFLESLIPGSSEPGIMTQSRSEPPKCFVFPGAMEHSWGYHSGESLSDRQGKVRVPVDGGSLIQRAARD